MHLLNITAGLLFQFIKIQKFVMKNIKKNYDEQQNKNIEDESKKEIATLFCATKVSKR